MTFRPLISAASIMLLASSSVWAQGEPPAEAPASPAASGETSETPPDEPAQGTPVPAVTPELPAAAAQPQKPCPTCVAPETLFNALMSLMSPDKTVRIASIGQLSVIDDSRAIGALIHALTHDRAWIVRSAAAQALGGKRGPGAVEALRATLGSRTESLAVKRSAAESLGRQQSEAAFLALWSHRGEYDSPRGKALRGVMKKNYPKRYAAYRAKHPSKGVSGRAIIIPAMALHGGIFMSNLAGLAGGSEDGLTFVGGAAIGGVTPLLLTRKKGISRGDAAWLATTTTWGMAAAPLTTVGIANGGDDDLLRGMLLFGQAAGLATGYLTLDRAPFSAGDVLYINAAGIAGAMTVGSVVIMADLAEDLEARTALVVEAGFIGGAVLAGNMTRSLKISAGDATSIAMLTAAGHFGGSIVPYVFGLTDEDDRFVAGGALLGGVLGFVGGTVLAQSTNPTSADVMRASLASSWGMALGTGLVLSSDLETHFGRYNSSAILVGGALGAWFGAKSTGKRPIGPGGHATILAGMGWGIWQGGGFGSLAFNRDSRQSGASLVGYGIGGLGSALLVSKYQPAKYEVGMVASAGFWGGWLGGFGSYLGKKHDLGVDEDDILLATLLGSDLGLGLGILALSPYVGMKPERLGWINLAGTLGMGVGTSFAAVAGDDIAEGNVIGTSLGLIGGVVMTANMEFKSAKKSKESSQVSSNSGAWWPTFSVQPMADGTTRFNLGLMGIN